MCQVEWELLATSEHLGSFIPGFTFYFVLCGSCCSIFSFLCSVSYMIVVLFIVDIALSVWDLRLLIIPLVFSNFSYDLLS